MSTTTSDLNTPGDSPALTDMFRTLRFLCRNSPSNLKDVQATIHGLIVQASAERLTAENVELREKLAEATAATEAARASSDEAQGTTLSMLARANCEIKLLAEENARLLKANA